MCFIVLCLGVLSHFRFCLWGFMFVSFLKHRVLLLSLYALTVYTLLHQEKSYLRFWALFLLTEQLRASLRAGCNPIVSCL